MPRNISLKVRGPLAACMAFAVLYALAWLAPVGAPASSSAQSGESIFVRKIAVKANDIAYSPSTNMIYASVPSNVGPGGNSIAPINPSTGEVAPAVFIGSEPNLLAMSEDGNTMYATLDGAFSIRRFEVQTQTPGTQFPVGSDNFFGLYAVNDLAVAPGEPGTVAVVRYHRGISPPEAGVAIFDNGVQRTKTGASHIAGSDYVAYSSQASKLYGGGHYDGLRTMTIDATGVASTSSSPNSVGARIKVAGGLVYGSSGKVMNPDTGALLGTFSGAGSHAFVPDAAAGRVYYLVRDSFSSITIRAFDTTTFLPVGSQTIAGVNGDPTTLLRWGTNGLAFRTTAGEVYVIQTSLIPSGSPIPTPTPTPTSTPTPTPTPAAAFIRQIPLETNGLAYNTTREALYVTLPSTAGPAGNSVAQVNTSTGALESPVFVGSEPRRMAFSDDGQTMYVGLTGAGAVRRLDLQTQTPGLQFSVGADGFSGVYFPDFLAVMPGTTDTVAVSRTNGGAAIYDNGVQRTKTAGGGSLQFGLNATRLYAGGSPVQKLTVDASGLTAAGTIASGRGGITSYFDKSRGLLFTSGGDVVDPEAGTILGAFTGLGFNSVMAVDPAAGRVYFLTTNEVFSSSGWKIVAYDMNTFLPIGFASLPGITETPSDLVRWGTNGLAFRITPGFGSGGSGSRVVLVETALIDGSKPIPTPTPTPTATPSPTPAYVPTLVRKVGLPAGDVVYNEATQSLYASVASTAGAGGNSITPVNPTTGAVGTPVFVGSEPGRLALGDDGQTLYVYLEGSKNMRRFNVQTMTPGIQFSVGTQTPADFDVMPGSPQSLAVSPGIDFSSGPSIYDDGVKRPKSGTSGGGNLGFYAVLPIEFGATPSVLYGYDSSSSGFELVKFTVAADGVTTTAVTYGLLSGFSNDIKFAGGLLYSSSGRVADPEARKLVGTFNQAGGVFAVDAALGRIYYLGGDGFSGNKVLKAYDINTFLPLGSVTLPNITGNPTRMVRWGANGLAVRTSNSNFGSQPNNSGLFIIQSALVDPSQPVPTGVALTSDRLNTSEFNTSLTVTVARTGDVAGATTVSYATSDGTATAGSDYTAASGTLTFAAGELTKTFTVPIKSDNVYEGSETFNVTLSDATGGSLSGPSSALVTIGDSSSRPFINISDVRVNEGNTGTTEAQFVVTLSNASTETVTVNYATGDATASSASDYVSTTGTLTFAPLETAALVKVTINGDHAVEPDETFRVNLSGAVNSSFISRNQATGTIANDDGPGRFQFGSPTHSVNEDVGSVTVTVNRVNGLTGAASINYATSNGTATAGSDYTAASGTLEFAEGEGSKTFTVAIANDTNDEPNETVTLTLSSPTGGALLGVPAVATITIRNDDRPTFQLTSAFYEAGEGEGQVVVGVTRTGDTSKAVTVGYTTSNGTATEISDYSLTLGTMRFAAGETSKTFNVLVTNDAFVEPDETFLVALVFPSGGVLGTPFTATVTLHNDDAAPGPNPLDSTDFFVRQHYHDFLNRVPDASGLNFWKGEIDQCGADAACREVKRINVSAAFFLSIEFQETGYFVYRMHQVAFNSQENLRWRTFLHDTQEVGRDVTVGVEGWEAKLEAKKKAYADAFASSAFFLSVFQGASNQQYVDALNANTVDPLAPGLGGALTQAERDQLVADLNESRKTRAEVLRAVAENAVFARRQANKAFVLMQYFGYLRRNPNDPPDSDFSGYHFWLGKLNEFNGNFIHAEMVKAFLNADEYKGRFGQ